MRILLLTTYFRPDLCSTGVIMTKLAEEFVSRGHEVTVVTSVPHYDSNRIWPEYSKRLVYVERRDHMQIYRLFTYVANDKASVPKRILAYGTFHLLSLLRAATLPRHDAILVPSPPLSNGVIADVVGRLRGTPFIYNVQDIWPDVAIRAGVIQNETAITLLRRMERYVYRRAAKLAVVSEGFRRNLICKGVKANKLATIPNFIDTTFVTPTPKRNTFSAEYNLQDRFVVLFAGNMGFSQGLSCVLDAAKLLEHYDDIIFLMVGNGASKPDVERYCRSLKLTNVQFMPYQAHEKVPSMYGSADVCLIPLKRGFTKESVPCKLFTIMAAGKPAVAGIDNGSDTAKLLQDARCGIVVEPENPGALLDAILYYRHNREERIAAGKRARLYVEANFQVGMIAESYLDLIRAAIDGSPLTEDLRTTLGK